MSVIDLAPFAVAATIDNLKYDPGKRPAQSSYPFHNLSYAFQPTSDGTGLYVLDKDAQLLRYNIPDAREMAAR